MTGVLDKEQTLTTLKIRKLFNQLVFATEKGFPYFKLQKTVMWMLIKRQFLSFQTLSGAFRRKVQAMALYYKRLSGAEVAKIFETYGIYGYITKYFESLHTMGDRYIVQDIDDYISGLVM